MCAFVVAKHFMRNLFFPPLTCFDNQGSDEVQITEELKRHKCLRAKILLEK